MLKSEHYELETDIEMKENINNITQYKTIMSSRGRPQIVIGNYKYGIRRKLLNGQIKWICPESLCNASILTDVDGTILQNRGEHKHPPYKKYLYTNNGNCRETSNAANINCKETYFFISCHSVF